MSFLFLCKKLSALVVAISPLPAGPQPAAAQHTISRASIPTAAERFGFGKSIFVKNEHGSQIPFDVINSDIQGWGRFTMLNTPDKADFIAEVTSYGSGAVTLAGSSDSVTPEGRPRQSTGVRRDLSAASVTLKVYDGKTKRELWSGTERVKSAFKKRSEEDNMVASAEKLFRQFHDSVEPPAN